MRLAPAAIAVLLVVSVVPAPAQTSADPDMASLAIDAGRLMEMVDQSEEALTLLDPRETPDNGQIQAGGDAYAFYELVTVVSRYNLVESRAYNAGVVDPKLCEEYRPAWLNGGPVAAHGPGELRAMIDEAARHIEPFWSDICARAKRTAKVEHFCQLE
jgi:hypothetical protein